MSNPISPQSPSPPINPIRIHHPQQMKRYGGVQFTLDEQQLQQVYSRFTTVEASSELEIPFTIPNADDNELFECRVHIKGIIFVLFVLFVILYRIVSNQSGETSRGLAQLQENELIHVRSEDLVATPSSGMYSEEK